MRALVYTAPGRWEMPGLSYPRPQAGEEEVALEFAGVRGSISGFVGTAPCESRLLCSVMNLSAAYAADPGWLRIRGSVTDAVGRASQQERRTVVMPFWLHAGELRRPLDRIAQEVGLRPRTLCFPLERGSSGRDEP